jgi:hypothetical protein
MRVLQTTRDLASNADEVTVITNAITSAIPAKVLLVLPSRLLTLRRTYFFLYSVSESSSPLVKVKSDTKPVFSFGQGLFGENCRKPRVKKRH